MLVNFRRAKPMGCLIALGISLFAADQRAEAQGKASRPALPARPNVAMPQPHHARSMGNPQFNPSPLGNSPNFNGFNNNSGFQNNLGFQNNMGYSPFNNWNYADMNAWNNLNMTGWPYWNTVVNINPFNPAQSTFWSQPTTPGWNANPFIMNAAYNNMFNNFNMMNGGMNAFGMMGNGMAVGNWNGLNMPMNNWNGINPLMGNWGFNPAALMNLNGNSGAPQR